MTPFTKKFVRYLDGTLQQLEAKEQEDFEIYLDKLAEEQLEDGEENPIQYPPTKFFELELNCLNNIAFAVSDNPFVKSDAPKFIPECYLLQDGKIIGKIGPDCKTVEAFANSAYCENFRDAALTINDDRKIKIDLSDFQGQNVMILMTVRVNNTSKGNQK